MFVAINFKICDNSEDCSGITACPTEALEWDKQNKTITINNSKCITCYDCEEECPVDAIRVARTKEEFELIKNEIINDPREISDLLVDRYGAQPIKPEFQISEEEFEIQILKAPKLCVVEVFSWETIECLVSSIPISSLFKGVDLKYRKIAIENKMFLKFYEIQKLPALLFFKNAKLINKIEGYFEISKKEKLKSKIDHIINNLL